MMPRGSSVGEMVGMRDDRVSNCRTLPRLKSIGETWNVEEKRIKVKVVEREMEV